MKTTTFTIEGMHCDGCARTIEALAGSKPGVHKVEVSFATGQAHILYDPKAMKKESLVTAIERGGFRVKARAS